MQKSNKRKRSVEHPLGSIDPDLSLGETPDWFNKFKIDITSGKYQAGGQASNPPSELQLEK